MGGEAPREHRVKGVAFVAGVSPGDASPAVLPGEGDRPEPTVTVPEGHEAGPSRPGPPIEGSRDERLARVIAECSDRLNAGEALDRRRILEEHPDLADDLAVALDSLVDVERSVSSDGLGGVLGDFKILREMGRGGMGVVYEAWQTSMDRRVALKVLPPGLVSNKTALARFEREAKVAGQLNHPNIVSVHGKGIASGTPYFAMEFVEGEPLDRILSRVRPSRQGPGSASAQAASILSRVLRSLFSSASVGERRALRSPSQGIELEERPGELRQARTTPFGGRDLVVDERREEAAGHRPEPAHDPVVESRFDAPEVSLKYCLRVAEAFADVADGLQHAHQKGVIHRDLKPSNLILDRAGKLRILDFGLARMEGQADLTVSGEFLGTPLYMSPEQAMAHRVPVDHRTDIYSLGATMYEVLTRQPPFSGINYKETLHQVITRDPEPLRRLKSRIPRSLETIVLKCLMKAPGDRYGTAEALAQDLRRLVRGDPIEARPQPLVAKVARRAWRRKWRVAAFSSVLLLCVTTGLLVRHELADSRQRAMARFDSLVEGALVKIQEGRPVLAPPPPRSGKPESRTDGGGLAFEVAYAEAIERSHLGWDPVEAAETELREAIAIFPDLAVAHYYRSMALQVLDRVPEATDEATLALRCDPAFVPAQALREALSSASGSRPPEAGSAGGEGRPRAGPSTLGWQDAWRVAHGALSGKDWRAAADAFTVLLRHARERETYLGCRMEAMLGRGRALLECGELDRALVDFGGARHLWPDLVEPALLLGKTYYLKKSREDARDALEDLFVQAGQEEPRSSEVALRTAAACFRLGELADGHEWSLRASESPERELLRANLLVTMGRIGDALESALRSVELGQDSAASHETLGYVRYRGGEPDRALAEFERALQLDPGYFPARKNLAFLLHLQDRLEEADRHYRLALGSKPGDAGTRSGLGEVLRRLGKLDESIDQHHRAIQLDGTTAGLHHNLGIALRTKGDVAGAIEEYRRAAALEGESPARLSNLGRALALWQGKSVEAIEQYEKAIALDPEYWPARYNLLLAVLRTDGDKNARDDKARDAAESALRVLEPLADSRMGDDAFRTAYLDTLEKLARLSKDATEARRLTARCLGFLKRWTDRPGVGPKDVNRYAWTLLTCLPEDLRDPAEALEQAKRAAELSRNEDPEILDTLAEALFLAGQVADALTVETKALGRLPRPPRNSYDRDLRKAIEANLARFQARSAEGDGGKGPRSPDGDPAAENEGTERPGTEPGSADGAQEPPAPDAHGAEATAGG